jgi:predicted aspartyl protease
MARKTGTFGVALTLPTGEIIRAMVDTGAAFTKLPADLLERHGVRPLFQVEVELGNGAIVQRPVGYLEVGVLGRRAPVPVSFGRPGERAILGATALEILGFSADTRNRRLVPTPALELLMSRPPQRHPLMA